MEQRSYNTRQRLLIRSYIEDHSGRHFSADDVLEHLKKEGSSVGKSTIYRYLDKLVADGTLRRFYIGEGQSACYQYDAEKHCAVHYHCKCVHCGKLLHIDCEQLDNMSQHIASEHSFRVDPGQTIFYGECESCRCEECPKKSSDEKPD